MTTDTLTLADCLRLLADAEDKDGQSRFRDAEGKALFRRECPPDCTHGVSAIAWSGSTRRWPLPLYCAGKGWLPLREAEATIERALVAARNQNWYLSIIQGWMVVVHQENNDKDFASEIVWRRKKLPEINKRGGSQTGAGGADLPVFASAGNLEPHIDQELGVALTQPKLYQTREGGEHLACYRALVAAVQREAEDA